MSKTKNILFICSANKDRSKTTEDYFSEKYPDFNFRSAGTDIKLCYKLGTNPLKAEDIEWADTVYTMENKNTEFLETVSTVKIYNKVHVLGIPDIYKYYQKELIEIFKVKSDHKFIKI